MAKIISRKDARALGLTHYFTNKPCSQGHLSERQSNNGGCCVCVSEYGKRWYADNRQKAEATRAAWRAANYEKVLADVAAYQATNRKYLALKRREYVRAHPEKIRTAARRRTGAIRLATPSWVNTFFVQEAYRLAQLRTRISGTAWEVDHIVPVQSKRVCGLHWEGNIRVVPRPINKAKFNSSWPDMP